MREIIAEIGISATPARVWGILVDLRRYGEWNPFITRADGDVGRGERLSVRIEPPGGRVMNFKPIVTQAVPRKELRWLGRFLLPGLFDGEHIFEIMPRSGGGVLFVQRERFDGILAPFVGTAWKRASARVSKG